MLRAPLSVTVPFGGRASIKADLLPRARYEAAYVAPCGLIGFAFESQFGCHSFGSDRRVPFRTRPNSLAFTPAGCDVYSRSNTGGEYLLLEVGDWHLTGLRQFNDASSSQAYEVATAIRRHLLGGLSLGQPVLADLVSTMLTAVAGECDVATQEPRNARWITRRRLRLIDDYIDANIHDCVTVTDLAVQLDLSVGFFSRAFRAYFGMSPHAYVMDRRLSRARGLLRDSSMSIAEVAANCGFANQAHMTTAFRRTLKITPGALDMGTVWWPCHCQKVPYK
jgi:AraC family transcriptional regulator